MEHRAFGRTGLTVPVIGMGTWHTYDVRGAEAAARRAVTDAALETGANFFDSSPMYGEAERVLGRTLEDRRDAAIVATKVWTDDEEEAGRQIKAGLRFFGGRVDVYQVHNLVAAPRRIAQLADLQARGLVRRRRTDALHAVRVSRDAPPHGGSAGGRDTGPLQPGRAGVEAEILPAAADLGVGVIVMRPLGQGRLARREVPRGTLKALRPFGVTSWPQALLKWILSDPRCHVVIPATSSAGAHARERRRRRRRHGSARTSERMSPGWQWG